MASLLTFDSDFLHPARRRAEQAREIARRPQIPLAPGGRRLAVRSAHPLRDFVFEVLWIVLLALMLVVGTRVVWVFVAANMPVRSVHVNEGIVQEAPARPDGRRDKAADQTSSETGMRTI